MTRSTIGVFAVLAALVGALFAPGAARAEPLPVTFSFFAGIPNELAHPG